MNKIKLILIIGFFSLFKIHSAGTTLVFPFENLSGDDNLNWLGYGLEFVIEDSMDSISYCNRTELIDQLDLPEDTPLTIATQHILAKRAGADNLVIGNFNVSGPKVLIHIEIYDISVLSMKKLTVDIDFENMPVSLKGLVEELGGKWIYPETLNPHFFEKYVKGLILACRNSEFTYLNELTEKFEEFDLLFRRAGEIHAFEGNFEEAFGMFKKINNPDYSDLFKTAMMAVKISDYNQSLEYFMKTIQAKENKEVLVNIAGCLHENGKNEEGLIYLDYVMSGTATHIPELFYNRALLYASLNRYADALSDIQNYVKQYKMTDHAEELMGYCCSRIDAPPEMCSIMKSGEKIESMPDYYFLEDEGNDAGQGELAVIKKIYFENAVKLIHAGNLKLAEDYLKKLLYFEPFNQEVLKLLCNEIKDEKACEKIQKTGQTLQS